MKWINVKNQYILFAIYLLQICSKFKLLTSLGDPDTLKMYFQTENKVVRASHAKYVT